MKRVLVGTSGWAYDEWVGPFYPKALARGRWLDHYGQHFPCVEVNASHYHFPDERWVAGMVDRMAGTHLTDVIFKAPREITHEAVPDHETENVEVRSAELFQALGPARDADLLAGVLYQFDHVTGPDALLPSLRAVLAAKPPCPIFVEVRAAAFNEERNYQALRELIEPRGGAVVATDSPASTITRAPPAERGYFRFHGRNEATWFLKDPPGEHGSARYDYLYPDEELDELAERVQGARVEHELYVFFNNHAGGKAPTNAQRFMQMLEIPPPEKRATLDDFQ